jgi:O-antigen ligase
VYLLAKDKLLRNKIWNFWPARLIGIYATLLIVCGFVALAKDDVSSKAMWYGLLIDLRFLVFFLAVFIIAAKSNWLKDRWKILVFAPAVLVAAFAIFQYLILPYDFLKHFGYGSNTISPYETINHNINNLRVSSTLRGANPLGAYLLLPISALAVLILKEKRQRSDKYMIGFGLILALIFSFSRSAWIGVIASLGIIVWVLIKSEHLKKNLALGFVGLVILGGILAWALRNNTSLESVLYHTNHTSKIALSSNEGHSAAFKSAARDIYHQPLGRGVGTAGPASVYNYQHAGRISENYFLQIGQEAGLAGMVLFIAICVTTALALWKKRADPLALALFASLIGITFVNLLSHAWTDDTLAYVWWGLAGIALAPKILSKKILD